MVTKPALNLDIIEKEETLLNTIILLSIQYPRYYLFSQIEKEIYTYVVYYIPGKEVKEIYFYNDFDDYEDGIEIGTMRWLKAIGWNENMIKAYNDYSL